MQALTSMGVTLDAIELVAVFVAAYLATGLALTGYDRIRPSLNIESNLKSGIVRGDRSVEYRFWSPPPTPHMAC